mmetsp:Transcript_36583/g.49605  ORF Transcript_36583/g.49605 Transcript_36583/m.49605 type:complete len:127 (+) Transcript_36583:190-570(+)
MGVIAFGIDVLVEELVLWKWEITNTLISASSIWAACLTFMCFSALLGGTAAILTVFMGPGAAGSGIAELMGYFNGVNYPKLVEVNTLIVKIFGMIFAVAAGLCVGKEGPLAHIGAIVGHSVVYLPF